MTVMVVWLMSCPPKPILAHLVHTPKEAHCSLAAKGRVSVPNREAGNPPSLKAQPAHVVGWLGFDETGTREQKTKQAKRDQ